MDTLEERAFNVTDKKALVFGSGGGARAVVFILNWLRASSIQISGRTSKRVDDIIKKIGGTATSLEIMAKNTPIANIIINTTPISSPDDSPEFARFIANQHFKECELIVDLNYGRQNNIWQSKASELGVPFIDGLTPLAHAARRTLLLWTRIDVEPSEFLKAIDDI
ncbi:AroE2 protein [Candidatus Magnetoovum chiemensis]|nr:AroE2 protein [Candidatus Magnetoovum chiemensis]